MVDYVPLSQPDGPGGDRYTPDRSVRVRPTYQSGRFGGHRRNGYVIHNLRTGECSQSSHFDGARSLATTFYRRNQASAQQLSDSEVR